MGEFTINVGHVGVVATIVGIVLATAGLYFQIRNGRIEELKDSVSRAASLNEIETQNFAERYRAWLNQSLDQLDE